jgi:pyruvate formate lyase activating enzyme
LDPSTTTPERSETGRSGIVFDVQRFSVHDGPGIRTLVFLKGCPLRCAWCANPESQAPAPQLGFHAEACTLCLRCVSVCPNGAEFQEKHAVPWEDCIGCLECVDQCLSGARVVFGRRMTVEEVIATVRRDVVFFRNSGGGVTIGGGEATVQAAFTESVLEECKRLGIHTAIETCGHVAWPKLERILRHVDVLLYDIKHMDSGLHRERTGVGNETILENAARASRLVPQMVVRYPLIPGFNDDAGAVEAAGAFLQEQLPAVRRVDVMPYHSVGASKGRQIGKPYAYDETASNSPEAIARTRRILQDHGLEVSIGG